MVEWGSPENTIQNAVQQTRLPYWQYDSPVKSQDKKSEPFWFPYLTHVMISARKRPTNMETTKAISVALVLHCMAPLRMSKYPNWSIWRKVTNNDYFRIKVTLRKTRRPSGARSKTPRYIWSSILAQSDWLSEVWVAQIFFSETINNWTSKKMFFHPYTIRLTERSRYFAAVDLLVNPDSAIFLYLTSFRFKKFPFKVQNISLHCFSIWCKTKTIGFWVHCTNCSWGM